MSFEQGFNRLWHTIAGKFRKRRRERFVALFPPDKISSIVDLGGLVSHWDGEQRDITVLNLMPQESNHCKVLVGDGRHTDLPDRGFDLAYSNSAIEHVGKWQDQVAFAQELQRVGKLVYCQTPNRWFPLEVHYLTFFWHWYPKLLRNYFIVRYFTGWGWLVRPDRRRVQEYADTVRLLTYNQMKELFPGCSVERERFLGLTKSLIAISEPGQNFARVEAPESRAGAPVRR
jgi:Methyltransferase domain